MAAALDAPTLADVPTDGDLTPDEYRELSRAAKQAASFTERRNAMIRELHERGRSLRAIAKAAGLNSGTVHTMLHGRKR